MICSECGIEVVVIKYGYCDEVFCSRKCKSKYLKKRAYQIASPAEKEFMNFIRKIKTPQKV